MTAVIQQGHYSAVGGYSLAAQKTTLTFHRPDWEPAVPSPIAAAPPPLASDIGGPATGRPGTVARTGGESAYQ